MIPMTGRRSVIWGLKGPVGHRRKGAECRSKRQAKAVGWRVAARAWGSRDEPNAVE